MSRYALEFATPAARQIRKLDPQVRSRIRTAIEALCDTPRPAGAKALTGSANLLRIRAGDWRVIYRVEDERLAVVVVEVGHRREIYRDR